MIKYLAHPVVNGAMIVTIITILITGFSAANDLENRVIIGEEKDKTLEQGIKELKEGQKRARDSDDQIQNLLNQILLKTQGP